MITITAIVKSTLTCLVFGHLFRILAGLEDLLGWHQSCQA